MYSATFYYKDEMAVFSLEDSITWVQLADFLRNIKDLPGKSPEFITALNKCPFNVDRPIWVLDSKWYNGVGYTVKYIVPDEI